MAESTSRFVAEAKELAEAGQFGKAIEVLQQGLKKFPKMVSARVLLGEIYMTSGDFESAKVELEQVIKTAPDNFAAYRKLALVYRDLKDTHAAAKACEIVLSANPKDREMKDLLEGLLVGSEKEKPQAPSSTVRLSRSPVAPQPSPAPAAEELALAMPPETEETDSETLAELYIAQGHREKGLEVYRRLAAKDSDNMRLHEKIMALEEAGVGADQAPAKASQESPAQATRKARIRRLEGWLAAIRERRRS